VFDASKAGTAGWISAQIEYQTAIGGTQGQNAQTNIGSLTNPTGIWSTHSGFRVPELAWQESFQAGQVVVLAGVVNQGNYIDTNIYANTGRGQFTKSALINSMVLPLPAYNYGLNLQWQPSNDWYTTLGHSVGNAGPGDSPLTDFSWASWSVDWEVGYAPSDFLGLGPDVYRIQPSLRGTADRCRAASPSTCSSSSAVTRRSAGSGVSASVARRCRPAPRRRSAPVLSCRPRSNMPDGFRS
jgi:hypothetical protein